MRTSNFEYGFVSFNFRHISSDNSFSAHTPQPNVHSTVRHNTVVCIVWSRAFAGAAPQSQHQEEKSGEASCGVSLRFSCLSPQAPTLQKVDSAVLKAPWEETHPRKSRWRWTRWTLTALHWKWQLLWSSYYLRLRHVTAMTCMSLFTAQILSPVHVR